MDDYRNIINHIAQINRLTGAPELTRSVESLLEANEKKINLAVLGQFKSGKSSLINNLIGINLLPVGVVPVTAIVTRLQYGFREKLKIRYADNTEAEANLTDLPLYVTEKCNPENIQKVAIAMVEHPALEQFKDICLVDTPGLNSFYKHNSEATWHWLPYTGAAIVAISAERPLSEEDINLIKGISIRCCDIFIVITKTDLFKLKELGEIKRHINHSIKNAVGREIPLFEYSVSENARKFRDNIFKNIIEPLNQHFEQKFDRLVRYKIKTCAEQSVKYAELVLQAAIKRKNEKDIISNALAEINRSRHHHEREMQLSCVAFKGVIREKFETVILPHQDEVERRIFTKFQNDFYSWNGSLFSVSRKFEHWLKTNLETEITFIDDACFDQINLTLKEPVSYYEYSALQFRQRIMDKLTQLFGVSLPDVSWQIEFAGIDKPDISVYRTFDSHLDMILFFMPVRWFKRLFYSYFQKQIAYEINKNLQRYISGLTGRIIKCIDQIHEQALRFIGNEQHEIEQILGNDASNCIDFQECIADLQSIQAELSIT